MEITSPEGCDLNLIPAYVDGELEAATQSCFENHLEVCAVCRANLRLHQQLICELDSVMATDTILTVPLNFSQVVAARAVSDMSGVRSSVEKRRALLFCLLLGVAGFALVGATSSQIARSLEGVLLKVFGIVDFAWKAIYDSVLGIAVITKALSRKLIIETGSLGFVFVLLALAIVLLSRLIASYHRTDAID